MIDEDDDGEESPQRSYALTANRPKMSKMKSHNSTYGIEPRLQNSVFENERSNEDNMSIFVSSQLNMMTNYHGFYLQGFTNENKELKLALNSNPMFMDVLE